MIDLHSPPHRRGQHTISSWIILWWRWGLTISLSDVLLVVIIVQFNDLHILG
jgi:hypothetical protein